MRKLAIALVLSAALCLGACSEKEAPLPEPEAQANAAAAVAAAEAKAAEAEKAAKEQLEAKLKQAKTNDDLLAVYGEAGKHREIKAEALKRLEKNFEPKIAGGKWADLEEATNTLPSSSPKWLEAYNKKEALRQAAKK